MDLERWFTRKRDFLPLLGKRLTHGAVILFGTFPDTGRPGQVVRCTQVNPARAETIREFFQDSPQASHKPPTTGPEGFLGCACYPYSQTLTDSQLDTLLSSGLLPPEQSM